MGEHGIGQGIKRVEDVRLLRGRGRYLDDVNVPGQTHAVILRSVHAHARIRGIDFAAALRAPGVLAVFTGADVAGLGTMSMTLKRKRPRSEEHTSELQSRSDLVCRLLLEKKK